ncbi:MAG: peptidoglycan DD-metalloendopeptidase family protein [Propionibacteriaceae bacterium]|jgi:endonuclease/exonuclease/phosphatase family metal-dependent hydrolase|nr:peptidoglycan DD-metalloendopeptidase family protein [Propionibacteriaceae bacterium]
MRAIIGLLATALSVVGLPTLAHGEETCSGAELLAGWVQPLADADGAVNVGFGPQTDPLTGAVTEHTGVDLSGLPGTPILAAAAGKVKRIDFSASGWYITVYHSGGVYSYYKEILAASDIEVSVGDQVAAGQQLASAWRLLSGGTMSTLHFEIVIGSENVDPVAFYERLGLDVAGTPITNADRTMRPTRGVYPSAQTKNTFNFLFATGQLSPWAWGASLAIAQAQEIRQVNYVAKHEVDFVVGDAAKFSAALDKEKYGVATVTDNGDGTVRVGFTPTTAGFPATAPGDCPDANGEASAPSTAVKVMTWNVDGTNKTDQFERPWSKRLVSLVSWVKTEDPDVIGFQENMHSGTGPKQMLKVKPKLGGYSWYGLDLDHPIAWKTSRFNLVKSGSFKTGSTADPGKVHARPSAWVLLRDTKTNKTFYVISTHQKPAGLTSRHFTVRAAQMKRLVSKIKALTKGADTPVLVLGDFNESNWQESSARNAHITELVGAGFLDAYSLAQTITTKVRGASTTNYYGHSFANRFYYGSVRTNSPKINGYHIDFIWTRGVKQVYSWRVGLGSSLVSKATEVGNKPFYATDPLPSDHNPVIAQIEIG